MKRSGRLPEICDGFQAHLSTRASPKVPEVVTKFPDKVQLEEVTRLSSWPLQFQEKSPTEENIALFFFAKDVKRSAYFKPFSRSFAIYSSSGIYISNVLKFFRDTAMKRATENCWRPCSRMT